jgi:TM2 domain-containing membrane protein YozV
MMIPDSLRSSFERQPIQVQDAVSRDYNARAKSLALAYVAWLLLGWHYLYLRRLGHQIAFWLTVGGFFVWWFVDAFRIPGMVRQLNEDIARELMVQHRALT